MTQRHHAAIAASLALATGLVVAASLALAAASAHATLRAKSAAACTQTREGQKLRVVLRFRYRSTLSRVDNGVLTQRVLQDVNRSFGILTIRAATCKRPAGGWRVIDPIGIGYSSAGLNAIGQLRGKDLIRGWGVGLKSGAGGSAPRLDLQVMHCGKDNFFKSLKFLLDVPIPFLHDGVDLARSGGRTPAARRQGRLWQRRHQDATRRASQGRDASRGRERPHGGRDEVLCEPQRRLQQRAGLPRAALSHPLTQAATTGPQRRSRAALCSVPHEMSVSS